MRIYGVVCECPEDAADVKAESGGGNAARDRREAEERPPVECKPQEQLWPIGQPFHEGIDRHEAQRGRAERNREFVELQQNEEADRQKPGKEKDGCFDAHLPAGQGP